MGTHWADGSAVQATRFFSLRCAVCNDLIGCGKKPFVVVCKPCYDAGRYPARDAEALPFDELPAPESTSDLCRHCGREPEVAEFGMCASCQITEQLDAEAYGRFANETFIAGEK